MDSSNRFLICGSGVQVPQRVLTYLFLINNPFILIKMSKTDFIPFVFHTKNLSKNSQQPRVTVVGRPDEDNKVLLIAVARCSKNDHFNKKTGRQIATDRLNNGQIIAKVPVNETSLTNFIACAQAVSDATLKHGIHQRIAVSLVPQPMKAKYELV